MGDEARPPTSGQDHPAGARQRRLGRRSFLRNGLAVGFGGGVAWSATRFVDPADAGTITYALARPAPDRGSLSPRRTEVPPVWHESLRLAFAARKRVREAAIDPLVDAAVVPGTYDEPEAGLSLTATTAAARESVGELVSSLPLDLDVVEAGFLEHESTFDADDAYRLDSLDPRAVPGGGICEGASVFGTLAPALFDATGDGRYFATSNHVFGAAGTVETDHAGAPLTVRHADGTAHVGNVVRGHPAADVVRVAPVDGYRPSPSLDRAGPSGVVGQYTKFGLADLAARDEPLTKVGAVSGRTTGQIHSVDGVTCFTGRICKTGQLTWGTSDSLADGDSGSVAFHPDPENPGTHALVAGVNNARTRWLGEFTWGTAAHHLLAAYGLHF